MLSRLALIAAAFVSVMLIFAADADAGSRWKFRYYNYDPDFDVYFGPEFVPQPRYFGYWRDRRRHRYEDDEDYYAYDPDYYEPEYIPPRKRKTYAKPQLKTEPKAAVKKKPKPTTISCAKAGQIVSDYGFKSVEQVTCKGEVYAFNATRDGKPFSIKLSAASGELTEVKKRK